MDRRPINLLLIEDNPGDARLFREQLTDPQSLNQTYKITWVTTLTAGINTLTGQPVDVILLDLSLPDSQGLETFNKMHEAAPKIPLLVLTGLSDENLALEAVSKGAQDYLDKNDITPTLLNKAIRYAIERQKAETALYHRERRFRALLENISDTILILDPQGKIQYLTPSIQTLLGYAPETLLNTEIYPLILPEDQAKFRQALTTLHQVRSLRQVIELRIQRENGTIQTLEGVIQNQMQDPAVAGFIITLRDITLRKRATEALTHSRDFHLSLLENFPTPIWRSGLDAKCNYFNRAWLDFTGVPLDQQWGDGWLETLHPAEQKRYLESYLQAYHTRQPFEFEHRLRHRDGEYHWMVNIAYPFNDLEGEFAGYLGSLYDITERKKTEEQLRASEERFRTLVASLGDVVFTLDHRRRFTGIYGPFEEHFQLNPARALGHTLEEIFPQQPLTPHQEAYNRALAGATRSYEWAIPNGQSSRQYQITLSPLRDCRNQVEGVVGIIHDITNLNQTLEALRRERDLVARIMETSPIGMLLLDPQGNITFTNIHAETVLRLPPGPDHRPQLVGSLRQILTQTLAQNHPLYNYRTTLETLGGTIQIVLHAAPIFDAADKIEALVVMVEDITEQIRAEQTLRASEKTFRALFDGINQVIFICDTEGKILVANEKTCQRLNGSEAELIGSNVFDRLPPAVARYRRQKMREAIESHRSLRFEDFNNEVYLESYVNPLPDADGCITRVAIFGFDLTEHRKTLQSLREREARLRAITENAPDFILKLSPEGKITFVNRVFPGRTTQGLIDQSIYTYVPPEYHTLIQTSLEQALTSKETHEFEVQTYDENDGRRWYRIRMGAINEEQFPGVIAMASDITHQKKLSENLAREAAANAAIADLGPLLLSNPSPDLLSEKILSCVCRLTTSTTAMTGYLHPGSQELTTYAYTTLPETPHCIRSTRNTPSPAWRWILDHPQPVLSNHPATEIPSLKLPPSHPAIDRLLSVPIDLDTTRMGQLVLINAERDYTAQDMALIKRLGMLYALALQRYQAETAFKDNEEKLRNFIQQSPSGITYTDEKGMVLEWNPSMEKISGLSRQAALTYTIWDIQQYLGTQDEEIEDIRQRLKEFYHTGEAKFLNHTSERNFKLPTGELRILQSRVFKIETSRGYMAGGILQDITEEKQIELKLRESEEKFRQITENIQEVFWIRDVVTQKMLYISPAFETIWGYSVEYFHEHLDLWWESIHPDDREQLRFTFNAGDQQGFEYRIRRADGEIRWIFIRAFPIMDQANRVYRIAGLAKDITQRKQRELAAEESLQHQIAQQTALAELTDLHLQSAKELTSMLQKMSEISAQALNCSRVLIWRQPLDEPDAIEILNCYDSRRQCHQELPKIPRTAIENYYQQLITSHTLVTQQDALSTELIRAGWAAPDMLASLNVQIRLEGQMIGGLSLHWTTPGKDLKRDYGFAHSLAGLIALMLEAATRVSAQEAQRDSEHRLKDIISFLPDATLAIDMKGRIVIWNHAMEELTGIKADNILYHNDYEYAVPFYGYPRPLLVNLALNPDPEFEKLYPLFHQENQTLTAEAHFEKLRPGGLYLWIKAAPLYNTQGQKIGAIETIRDISSHKHAEHALSETAQKLHATNHQLEDYTHKLEATNQLKELFIDILRHDLLNPLSVIDGFADLLLESPTNPDEQKAALAIKSSVIRLIEMIENATLYARLENVTDLPRITQNLENILMKAGQEIQPFLERKQIQLYYQEIHPLFIPTHPLIEQVFINLLSNAAKYSPVGRSIEVGLQQKPESYCVYVKDWGNGIADQDKSFIFDRFTRADRHGVKGSGLGLAIVKRITELHGGRVWVENNPEGGSIFFVELPKN